jgi:hypothetical protein
VDPVIALLILFAAALTTVWTVGAFDTHRPVLGSFMAVLTVVLVVAYTMQINS